MLQAWQEKHELKRCLEVLEKENKALNIKFVKLDQMDVENSVLNLKITLLSWQRYILVKMLLKFFKQGEVKQTHKWNAQSKADILIW